MAFPVSHIEAGPEGGSGPALIFLHGIGGEAESFRPQIEHFRDRYRAMAWDMPGYNDSTAIDPVTFPRLVASLASLLEHLGVDRAHVVGHSIGGMVAQELMAAHPEMVASLVLAQTSPSFGPPDGEFQRKFVADRLGPLDEGKTMADIASAFIPTLFGPGASSENVGQAVSAMARVPEGVYRNMVHCLTTFDRRAALADIRVPTLVLAGEKDGNAPAPMMEKMAAKIPGARYHCMAGLNHLANLEAPAVFNAAIDEFLAETVEA